MIFLFVDDKKEMDSLVVNMYQWTALYNPEIVIETTNTVDKSVCLAMSSESGTFWGPGIKHACCRTIPLRTYILSWKVV